MDLLIKSGRVIDPATSFDDKADVLVINGKIKAISKKLSAAKNMPTLDADGLLVIPGLIDMHCHLRDPGDPEEETIVSGTRSAALGGFTSIACMANTLPPIDSPALIKYITSKARMEGIINVFPIGAVSKGLKGEELVEIGRMIQEGAVAFSDDGQPIMNSEIMRRALEYVRQFDATIISHCEDLGLTKGGLMNESYTSTVLGLKGIPSLAEETMVARDIMLAKEFGRLHIAHVSSKKSVELIRGAKKEGINITAETCPHYFTLTEEEVEEFNTDAKVNPPLRSEKDLEAVVKGLKDGSIDVIATDHAPHRSEEKNIEFGAAANGMVGFETALALVLTELVGTGFLSIINAIEKMTVNPAKILNIKKGVLKEGWDADIAVIDPNAEWTVDVNKFASKSKNSPYHGWTLKGKVLYTIVGGRIIVKDGKLAF
ncbi:MAG: dihydroorotase [Candidatus Saganbacteria bacterium]|uniref:Dihydroorotase n=1 Tax=Candidatus Saganbacteria bacterium TaxID=2575572 RepID=A0A833KZY7_UNCSA|nr:MAG: dihydroorotase [Candidatus Saganbacteria bacterium]